MLTLTCNTKASTAVYAGAVCRCDVTEYAPTLLLCNTKWMILPVLIARSVSLFIVTFNHSAPPQHFPCNTIHAILLLPLLLLLQIAPMKAKSLDGTYIQSFFSIYCFFGLMLNFSCWHFALLFDVFVLYIIFGIVSTNRLWRTAFGLCARKNENNVACKRCNHDECGPVGRIMAAKAEATPKFRVKRCKRYCKRCQEIVWTRV